jgi:hypothetical protein
LACLRNKKANVDEMGCFRQRRKNQTTSGSNIQDLIDHCENISFTLNELERHLKILSKIRPGR